MHDQREGVQLTSLAHYQEQVPGRALLKGTGEAWSNLELRAHQYPATQPPMAVSGIPHHTLTIVYAGDVTGMRWMGGGAWIPFDTTAKGHVTIRPAGRPTGLRWTAGQPVHALSLYLQPERLEEVGLQLGIVPAQVELLPHFNVPDPMLQRLAKQFLSVAGGERAEDPLYLQTILQPLTIRLLRQYTAASLPAAEEAGCLSRPRFHRVRRYVHAFLDTDLSLDDLAQQVGLSKYYFSRRFKQRTGQSPYQFVIYERIRAARRQLCTTTRPLAQIALSVGFSSQSHFTRTFKQHVGVTPGQYRTARQT